MSDWPDVSDVVLRVGAKSHATPKHVVTGAHPRERFAWGDFEPPAPLVGPDVAS